MAKICPVCKEKIGFWQVAHGDVIVHPGCENVYLQEIKKTEAQIKTEKEQQERQTKQEEEALYKSVYIKGGVDINSFDMPFGDMVGFMVKWALASIPAFFILFIIFGIFFAIFGALFF